MKPSEEQREFLRSIKGSSWLTLLENMPHVCFFMKDREGRYMAANRTYAEHMGVQSPGDLIGKTDRDFHPGELSHQYVSADQEVMRTGKSLTDLVEPWDTKDGRFGWTITSKHPVYDKNGDAIGIMGFTQPHENQADPETGPGEGEGPGKPGGGDRVPALQSEFLQRMENPRGTRSLFEHLPSVQFFIKNRKRQIVAANRSLLERLGIDSEREIIGTTDEDHYQPELCARFAKDDRHVLDSGEPVIGRIEPAYNDRRLLVWHVTTKLPVYDRDGRVIGLMGINRLYEGPTDGFAPIPDASLVKATELVRQNTNRRVTSEEMAAAAGISVWRLRRKFRKAFGMSPHEFEKTSRIQAACRALTESDATLVEIAVDCGFCDQSAFSVQFRRQIGCTPLEYRKARGTGGGSEPGAEKLP